MLTWVGSAVALLSTGGTGGHSAAQHVGPAEVYSPTAFLAVASPWHQVLLSIYNAGDLCQQLVQDGQCLLFETRIVMQAQHPAGGGGLCCCPSGLSCCLTSNVADKTAHAAVLPRAPCRVAVVDACVSSPCTRALCLVPRIGSETCSCPTRHAMQQMGLRQLLSTSKFGNTSIQWGVADAGLIGGCHMRLAQFASQPGSSPRSAAAHAQSRWLFV